MQRASCSENLPYTSAYVVSMYSTEGSVSFVVSVKVEGKEKKHTLCTRASTRFTHNLALLTWFYVVFTKNKLMMRTYRHLYICIPYDLASTSSICYNDGLR